MFDVGLAEVAMIALVALLVLGPERLPRAARMAGLYVRKARATWHSIRSDIERELAAEDMKKALKDTQEQLGVDEIRRDLRDAERAASRQLKDPLSLTKPAASEPPASQTKATDATHAAESSSPPDPSGHDPATRN